MGFSAPPMQSLLAAAVLASLLPACASAGRVATPLLPGAITSEPTPPGEPFAADYEDDVMGGAPTVDSVVRTWAGSKGSSAFEQLDAQGPAVLAALQRQWAAANASAGNVQQAAPSPVAAAPGIVGVTTYQVIGQDSRLPVPDVRVYPFRTVGEIQFCQGPGDCGYSCTGTLIGPATVLTAGHCLYELGTAGVQGLEGGTIGAISGSWHSNISFTPGGALQAPFGGQQGTQAFVPRRFSQLSDAMWDIGVLLLGEAVGLELGWLGVADLTGHQDLDLQMVGFPTDKQPAGSAWWDECPGTSADFDSSVTASHQVQHQCDTFGGDSGSALWMEAANGGIQVAAVHTGRPAASVGNNLATKLDAAMRGFVFRTLLNNFDQLTAMQYLG